MAPGSGSTGSTGSSPPSVLLHLVAGGVGGTIGAAITCPLEVVKTRLQSSLFKAPPTVSATATAGWLHPLRTARQHVLGVVDILRSIREREGVRALWKGLGPNLVGVVPARAIYFAVYSQGKHLFASLNQGRETPIIHMLSAATASTATSVATSPIWLVKTRMQLQSEDPTRKLQRTYRNSLHCAYVVVQTEGIRGLYKGLSASLLGIGESALQFAIYEYLKKEILAARQEGWRARNPGLVPLHPDTPATLGWLDTFGSAAVAKLFAAAVTYPHEVVRTRMRQVPVDGVHKYSGLLRTFAVVYREEGMGALYGGLTAHLMRVVPNAAILFFCYELIVRMGNAHLSSLAPSPTPSTSLPTASVPSRPSGA